MVEGLAAGMAQPVGRFEYDVASGAWRWSPEVFSIYGFAAGEVVPTTELLIAHRHPEETSDAASTIKQAVSSGLPFSCRHRIVDAAGKTRTVVVVGHGLRGEDGLSGLQGYMVDVTESLLVDIKQRADQAVAAATANRAVIEQAKGALMLAFGVDADVAFSLLAARSMFLNVKLVRVAENLVQTLVQGTVAAQAAEQMMVVLWGAEPGWPRPRAEAG